jgi:hypothetical protein
MCVVMAAALAGATLVRADVTIEQKTTLDVASMIRMHGGVTTNMTADKKREETESHCEGMMSLVCGKVKSGEIVRLDRGVTWRLQPDKKSYREEVFATPEQLAEMRSKMQATLEKMRSCPVSQKQQPVDRSKCEMSPPKIDVQKTDETSTIAGHSTQRTLATLTETCTNKDTGDVCDTVVAFDLWLTQDELPGTADRREFARAYAKKLGLEDAEGPLRGEVAKFLAPYQSQIKQLTEKSGALQGQPLKTSLRVLMGGPQCSATAKTKDNSAQSAGNSASGASPLAGGNAIGSVLGGLFHKKKTDDSAAAASAAPGSSDPYAAYAQLASFTLETLTINTNAIPSDRFEVPPDWTKEVPPPSKQGDTEFTCPKIGS